MNTFIESMLYAGGRNDEYNTPWINAYNTEYLTTKSADNQLSFSTDLTVPDLLLASMILEATHIYHTE